MLLFDTFISVSSVLRIQALFDIIGSGFAYKVHASRLWTVFSLVLQTELFWPFYYNRPEHREQKQCLRLLCIVVKFELKLQKQ